MFAGISLIINSKAAGMSKTMRYTHKFRTWLNITLLYRNLRIKFHDFYKTFPGLEIAVLKFQSFPGFSWPFNPIKATDARFQSLKIWSSPSSNHMPDPLNLQIKHWATLLKVLLLTGPVFCITSAVSVLGAYKPCPREARRFRLALFCSLLKVY